MAERPEEGEESSLPLTAVGVSEPPPADANIPSDTGAVLAEDLQASVPCGIFAVPVVKAFRHATGCPDCRGRGGWYKSVVDLPGGSKTYLEQIAFTSPCGRVTTTLPRLQAHINLEKCEGCAAAGGLDKARLTSWESPSADDEDGLQGSPPTAGLARKGIIFESHPMLPASIFVVERMEFPITFALHYEVDRLGGYQGSFNDYICELMQNCFDDHLSFRLARIEVADGR